MRNVLAHPINLKEIEDCCRRAAEEYAKEGLYGDMRPSLLNAAAKIVSRAGFVTFNLFDPVFPPPKSKRKRQMIEQARTK